MENKTEFDVRDKMSEICMRLRHVIFEGLIEMERKDSEPIRELFCLLSSFIAGIMGELVGDNVARKQEFLQLIVAQVNHAWEQLDVKKKGGVH